jgi:hypothetical protein
MMNRVAWLLQGARVVAKTTSIAAFLICALHSLEPSVPGNTPAPAASPFPTPAFADTTDTSEQSLAVLDSQIQTAVMLAHFIWQTNKFAAFAERLTALAPDIAKAANGAAARYRSDIEAYLDIYTTLVLQIATGPSRLNLSARVERIDQDLSEQGMLQFKRFLPVLVQHAQRLQSGSTPSREQIRADILALPSATTR